METEYILELNGITKIFPGIKALDNVYFKLKPGEIHALMGENGAGKSTFIKVITGVYKPDGGEILLNGQRVDFKTPNDAKHRGIAAIYQHVTCFPDLSVTENIFMGHEKIHKATKRILWKEMHEEADRLLKELGAGFSPKTQMGELSVAEQLRDKGTAIIFISHRFEDMYRLASKVTVFRDSQYIGTWDVNAISNAHLIVAMVGREITQLFPQVLVCQAKWPSISKAALANGCTCGTRLMSGTWRVIRQMHL